MRSRCLQRLAVEGVPRGRLSLVEEGTYAARRREIDSLLDSPRFWIDAELLREIEAYFMQECDPGTSREKGLNDERRK
jgi:hypothetical protein